jgi:hypothetical protein
VLLQHLLDDALAVGGDADVALMDGRALVGGGERLGRVGAVGVADRDPDPAVGSRVLIASPIPRAPPVTSAT